MFTLRYLDVCLVLATAPFVLAGGLPLAGYLIAAFAWLLTRLGTIFMYARARRVGDPKYRAGLQVAGMMGRIDHQSAADRLLRGIRRSRTREARVQAT